MVLNQEQESQLLRACKETIADAKREPIFFREFRQGVCRLEIKGKTWELQVILNSDEDEFLLDSGD